MKIQDEPLNFIKLEFQILYIYIYIRTYTHIWGFPDSSVGKECTCSAGDPGPIPGLGRCAEEGIGYPLQYSWASLVAQLVESICNVGDLGLILGLGGCPGEGSSYPLQYSGLENSMECIVHGLTKSQT